MKVVVDKQIPFIKGVLEKYAEVVYLEGSSITRNVVLDADALIIRTRTKCNAALREGTKVRFIASATIILMLTSADPMLSIGRMLKDAILRQCSNTLQQPCFTWLTH